MPALFLIDLPPLAVAIAGGAVEARGGGIGGSDCDRPTSSGCSSSSGSSSSGWPKSEEDKSSVEESS